VELAAGYERQEVAPPLGVDKEHPVTRSEDARHSPAPTS
jgi:hypothetical protein